MSLIIFLIVVAALFAILQIIPFDPALAWLKRVIQIVLTCVVLIKVIEWLLASSSHLNF